MVILKHILAILNVEREKKDGGVAESCVWTTQQNPFYMSLWQ